MKWNQAMKGLGMLVLGLLLMAPAGFAQNDQNDRDRDQRDRNERSSRNNPDNFGNDVVQRGYQDGLRQGQQDRSRGTNRNYRNRDWQRADRGYDRSMGSRGQYKQAYREGYMRGYEDAFNGNNARRNGQQYPNNGYPNTGYPNNGYPNNGGYGNNALAQSAQQNGLHDGGYYAQMDRSKGNAYNPTNTKGYRDADHGYDSSLGNKSEFQRIYRENFVRGYQQGYGNVGYRQ